MPSLACRINLYQILNLTKHTSCINANASLLETLDLNETHTYTRRTQKPLSSRAVPLKPFMTRHTALDRDLP